MKSEGPISLTVAARRAGTTPETIARWCKRYGIGRQLHPRAPWRVDPVALEYVMAGEGAKLDAYQRQQEEARTPCT